LSFLYNDVIIDNIEVTDVKCIGENGNTSFILFDSGENSKKLSISNSKIINNKSNDSFIKIIGYSNDLIIENTKINNIVSYGPIIKNTSTKV